MKKVTKIIGRAGTGKTTYLINEVRKLLEDGVSPRDITMITFSVRAAAVFVERACAISEEYEKKHFKNFRTMHSMSSRLIGWEPDCAFTSKDWDIFYRRYYPELGSIDASQGIDMDTYYLTHGDKEKLKESSRFSAMESIDGLMRNLMIEHNDFNEMYMQTGRDMSYTQHYITRHYWDEKRDKYRINFDSIQGNIDPMDQIEFSKNFSEFKEMEGLMDFTDVIEKCLEIGVAPDTKYLFVDEFQDFTGLHYALYKLWRDSAEYVWICGDDAQTVQRWAGANARYFIDEPCDERIVLPQTYRHGKVIFDNAQTFLDRVTEIEICDVLPHPDIDGEVIKVYGDGWKSYLDFADDESVLVLAATKKWCGAIKNELEQLAPNILWTWLGTDAIVERVVRQYNVIADLERGLEVDWDRIEELFTSSNPLPTQMTFSERESTLEGIKTVQYEKKPMLMRIKHDITIGEFKNRDFYTKSSFGKDLLVRRWNGRALMSNIKDIEYFPQAHDHFPKEWNTDVLPESKKRIGTIHKSKGDESDTVVLFMSVPYPVLGGIGVDEVCDDLLRQFYVGATRPKYKLVEVYSYLSYQNGDSAPDPLSIVR